MNPASVMVPASGWTGSRKSLLERPFLTSARERVVPSMGTW